MHVHYLISEYFYIWVVTARPPALYDELLPRAPGITQTKVGQPREEGAHTPPLLERTPAVVSAPTEWK